MKCVKIQPDHHLFEDLNLCVIDILLIHNKPLNFMTHYAYYISIGKGVFYVLFLDSVLGIMVLTLKGLLPS